MMVILPTEFEFEKGSEGMIGYIEKIETANPELCLETEIVRFIFINYLIVFLFILFE